MPSVIEDLGAIRDENCDLLAAAVDDIDRLLAWGAWRELVFVRLHERECPLARDEQATAASLINEIAASDAAILVRLQQNLATLAQKRTAAVKMHHALRGSVRFYPSILLRQVA